MIICFNHSRGHKRKRKAACLPKEENSDSFLFAGSWEAGVISECVLDTLGCTFDGMLDGVLGCELDGGLVL